MGPSRIKDQGGSGLTNSNSSGQQAKISDLISIIDMLERDRAPTVGIVVTFNHGPFPFHGPVVLRLDGGFFRPDDLCDYSIVSSFEEAVG